MEMARNTELKELEKTPEKLNSNNNGHHPTHRTIDLLCIVLNIATIWAA